MALNESKPFDPSLFAPAAPSATHHLLVRPKPLAHEDVKEADLSGAPPHPDQIAENLEKVVSKRYDVCFWPKHLDPPAGWSQPTPEILASHVNLSLLRRNLQAYLSEDVGLYYQAWIRYTATTGRRRRHQRMTFASEQLAFSSKGRTSAEHGKRKRKQAKEEAEQDSDSLPSHDEDKEDEDEDEGEQQQQEAEKFGKQQPSSSPTRCQLTPVIPFGGPPSPEPSPSPSPQPSKEPSTAPPASHRSVQDNRIVQQSLSSLLYPQEGFPTAPVPSPSPAIPAARKNSNNTCPRPSQTPLFSSKTVGNDQEDLTSSSDEEDEERLKQKGRKRLRLRRGRKSDVDQLEKILAAEPAPSSPKDTQMLVDEPAPRLMEVKEEPVSPTVPFPPASHPTPIVITDSEDDDQAADEDDSLSPIQTPASSQSLSLASSSSLLEKPSLGGTPQPSTNFFTFEEEVQGVKRRWTTDNIHVASQAFPLPGSLTQEVALAHLNFQQNRLLNKLMRWATQQMKTSSNAALEGDHLKMIPDREAASTGQVNINCEPFLLPPPTAEDLAGAPDLPNEQEEEVIQEFKKELKKKNKKVRFDPALDDQVKSTLRKSKRLQRKREEKEESLQQAQPLKRAKPTKSSKEPKRGPRKSN
jgi:hypothetical protein